MTGGAAGGRRSTWVADAAGGSVRLQVAGHAAAVHGCWCGSSLIPWPVGARLLVAAPLLVCGC